MFEVIIRDESYARLDGVSYGIQVMKADNAWSAQLHTDDECSASRVKASKSLSLQGRPNDRNRTFSLLRHSDKVQQAHPFERIES